MSATLALERMNLFETMFRISMGVAIFGVLLMLFFFFRFDIPYLFALSTGRAKKKSMEEMHKKSQQGGSIRDEESGSGGELLSVAVRHETDGDYSTAQISGTDETSLLHPQADETSLLQNAPDTSILVPESGGTTVLKNIPSQDIWEAGETVALNTAEIGQTRQGGRNFWITEEVMFLHTDEIIP